MTNPKITRRQVIKGAAAVGALGALGVPSVAFADDGGEGVRVRWDIISVDFGTGTLSAGGIASADANDGSKITLTGSGTFSPGEDHHVTGGGTWKTFASDSSATGSGTYVVTGLVSWIQAPGTPPLPHDNIGNLADSHGGLAVLRIRYSDESRGILTVSCHIVGTPNSVFEGITATKGHVDYFNREAPPAPPENGNRTNFHVMAEAD
jgi:hypothetical protein